MHVEGVRVGRLHDVGVAVVELGDVERGVLLGRVRDVGLAVVILEDGHVARLAGNGVLRAALVVGAVRHAVGAHHAEGAGRRIRHGDRGHRAGIGAAAGLGASVGVPPHDPLTGGVVVQHLGALEDRGVVRRALRIQVVGERVDLLVPRLPVLVDGVVEVLEVRGEQIVARRDAAQGVAEVGPVHGIRRAVDRDAGAVPVPVRAVLAVPVVDGLPVLLGRDDLPAVRLDVPAVGVVPLRLEVVGGTAAGIGERLELRVRDRRVDARHTVVRIGGHARRRGGGEGGCQRPGENGSGGGREQAAEGEGVSMRHRVCSVPCRDDATHVGRSQGMLTSTLGCGRA